MNVNSIPEKLIAFRVYENGTDLLGVSDVQLPSLEYMTETVKGAGIAGEVDSPTVGHFGSMTLTLNWRAVTKPILRLAAPKVYDLDLRGAIQKFEASTGQYLTTPLKVKARATPKKTDPGKMDTGATSDASNELEILYIKMELDGETLVEIDKYNYICVIDGVDYLAQVRSALGLAK